MRPFFLIRFLRSPLLIYLRKEACEDRRNTNELKKALLLSDAAALVFGALAVGTTCALFTSKAEADVSIGPGKVAIKILVFRNDWGREIKDENKGAFLDK